MAEAMKESKSKGKSPRTNESRPSVVDNSEGLREVTDKNLEKRLKSLTSFINNIEPTPKEQGPIDGQVSQQPVKVT